MADRRVTILPGARADLAAIFEVIRFDKGPLVAEENIQKILDKIDLLAFMPNIDMSRKRRTLADGTVLRFAVARRWIVVYEDREKDNVLIVIAVVDGVQNVSEMEF